MAGLLQKVQPFYPSQAMTEEEKTQAIGFMRAFLGIREGDPLWVFESQLEKWHEFQECLKKADAPHTTATPDKP